jgi:hypothetical protein
MSDLGKAALLPRAPWPPVDLVSCRYLWSPHVASEPMLSSCTADNGVTAMYPPVNTYSFGFGERVSAFFGHICPLAIGAYEVPDCVVAEPEQIWHTHLS